MHSLAYILIYNCYIYIPPTKTRKRERDIDKFFVVGDLPQLFFGRTPFLKHIIMNYWIEHNIGRCTGAAITTGFAFVHWMVKFALLDVFVIFLGDKWQKENFPNLPNVFILSAVLDGLSSILGIPTSYIANHVGLLKVIIWSTSAYVTGLTMLSISAFRNIPGEKLVMYFVTAVLLISVGKAGGLPILEKFLLAQLRAHERENTLRSRRSGLAIRRSALPYSYRVADPVTYIDSRQQSSVSQTFRPTGPSNYSGWTGWWCPTDPSIPPPLPVPLGCPFPAGCPFPSGGGWTSCEAYQPFPSDCPLPSGGEWTPCETYQPFPSDCPFPCGQVPPPIEPSHSDSSLPFKPSHSEPSPPFKPSHSEPSPPSKQSPPPPDEPEHNLHGEERAEARKKVLWRTSQAVSVLLTPAIFSNVGLMYTVVSSTAVMAFGFLLFLCCIPLYHRLVDEDTATEIFHVSRTWDDRSNGYSLHRMRYHSPTGDDQSTSQPHRSFVTNFLSVGKARKAEISHASSRQTMTNGPAMSARSPVEQRKPFHIMIPMWTTFLVIGLVLSTGSTLFIEEASTMKPTVSIYVLLLIRNIISPTSSSFLKFFVKCIPIRLKMQGIIGGIMIAMGLSVFCSIAASRVEVLRLNAIMEKGLCINEDDNAVVPLSILLLAPQFCLLALTEGIGKKGLELFLEVRVSDKTMRQYGSELNEAVIGLGSFINVLLVFYLRSWFRDNLNCSRLKHYYEILMILSFVNLFYYWLVSTFCLNVTENNVE